MLKALIRIVACIGCVGISLSLGQGIAGAQSMSMQSMSILEVRVSEKGNRAPVQMATVYLVPVGDTVATAFTLTDKRGAATLKYVVPGKYNVNVQMLGFKPYVQEHTLRPMVLECISVALEEDVKELEGASVTEMGDLVTVKGDTLIYNATSFRTSNNANLADLLKKMPGIEVDNGAVTVNGEPVRRITIEGKTFFFDDQAKALENLPAFVVNKIKVIDRETRERSGITGKQKEIDVKLKDEYKNAWFGKLSGEGGVSVNDRSSVPIGEPVRGLFNAKLYAQHYDDNDALTMIGGGNNVNAGKLRSASPGLSEIASAGVNYNTSRIPNFKTTASASYDFRNDINESESHRTSFLSAGRHLETDRFQFSRNVNHSAKGGFRIGNSSFEMLSTEGFEASVDFLYNKRRISSESSSLTRDSDGTQLNVGNSLTNGNSDNFGVDMNFRAKYFLDKAAKHDLSFSGNIRYDGTRGGSEEKTLSNANAGTQVRSLLYADKVDGLAFNGHVDYFASLSRDWRLYSSLDAYINSSKDNRDARNTEDQSYNEYYSRYSTDRAVNLRESVSASYGRMFGRRKRLDTSLGLCLYQDNISHYATVFGTMDNRNGVWAVNAGPDITLSYRDSSWRCAVYTRGKSVMPQMGAASSPVLDVSNPLDISTGNIYLKTGYHQDLQMSLNRLFSKGGMHYINMRLGGSVDFNEVTRASWFDNEAVRYSIPVNAKRPRYNATLNVTYLLPLNKKRSLNLSIVPRALFSAGTIYIAKGALRGLDTEAFNYSEMMSWLYGDASGSEFYSGRSGFIENRTYSTNWSVNADLKYEISDYSIRGGASVANSLTKYSASPSASVNNWKFNAYAEVLWRNRSGWEAEGRFDFNGYRGFTGGYNRPEYLLNLRLAKAIKSFTVSLSAYDILGSAKSFSHMTSAEYAEDTYRLNLGRCILVGLSYNFGKWDFSKKSKADYLESKSGL